MSQFHPASQSWYALDQRTIFCSRTLMQKCKLAYPQVNFEKAFFIKNLKLMKILHIHKDFSLIPQWGTLVPQVGNHCPV